MMTFRSALPTIRRSVPLLHHAAALSAVVLLGYQTVAVWLSLCGNSLPSLLAMISATLVALTIAALLQPLDSPNNAQRNTTHQHRGFALLRMRR